MNFVCKSWAAACNPGLATTQVFLPMARQQLHWDFHLFLYMWNCSFWMGKRKSTAILLCNIVKFIYFAVWHYNHRTQNCINLMQAVSFQFLSFFLSFSDTKMMHSKKMNQTLVWIIKHVKVKLTLSTLQKKCEKIPSRECLNHRLLQGTEVPILYLI